MPCFMCEFATRIFFFYFLSLSEFVFEGFTRRKQTVKKGVGKWKTLSISFVLLVLLLLFWYFSCHWCRVYVGNVLLATSRQIFWINNWWSLKMWKTVNLKRLKILITYCASWLKFVWILAWFSNKASSKNLLLWKYLIYSANFTPYS